MQSFIADTKCIGPVFRPSFINENESIKCSIKNTNESDSQYIDICEMSRLTTCWIHKINFHVACKKKSKIKTVCVGDIV